MYFLHFYPTQAYERSVRMKGHSTGLMGRAYWIRESTLLKVCVACRKTASEALAKGDLTRRSTLALVFTRMLAAQQPNATSKLDSNPKLRHKQNLGVSSSTYTQSFVRAPLRPLSRIRLPQGHNEMANSSSNADLVWRKYNRQVPAGTAGAHRKRQYTALWDKLTEDEQKEVAVAITQANYAHKWVLYELYKYSKVKRCQVLEPWIIQVGNNDTTARTVERLIRARIKYLQMAGDLLVLLQGIGAGVAVQRVEYDRMAQHVGAIRMEQDVVASIVAPTDASTPQRQLDIINIQEETSRLKKAGWEGNYHHIKTGGQGQVGLWVRKENGRITDRVVVKDNHYSKPDDRRLWTSHLTWTGNLDDLVYRKPIEVEAMERLQATGADCILRLRGKWRVFEEKMLYKIYTEYCPYGTLRDLINDEAAEGEDYPANEPLAWWIFKNLGDMGLLMEQGDLETPVPGWKQIVHSDIKPDNILLTDRSGDGDIDFPLYKQPVLDDFGLAVFTSPNDPHNPDDYTDRGTPSFKAPEQCATRGDEGEEERVEVEKLGAKTNV